MHIVSCPMTGRVFDMDALPRSPVRFVPGTRLPVDTEGVDFLYPVPSKGDPQADAKLAVREQALADVAQYASE